MKKNNIKSAIARIFTAIINADGIVSAKELDCLEKYIKPKYQLFEHDFEEARKITFAEAVQIIKTDSDKKSHYVFDYKEFVDDIELLAQIDGSVHTKEALLCLAFKHTVDDGADYLKAKLISCGNNHLKFSKKEIIYVESETDDYINNVIAHNYEIICYLFQSFGFQFVYIPKIREKFLEYSEEYQQKILRYLYPYIDNVEIHKSFIRRLYDATTVDFTNMLLCDCEERIIKPSLLIKIASTQARNRDNLTDFLLLDVQKNGFLTTIQRFLSKYDSLSSPNTLQIQRGNRSSEFDSKSFHRTFVEYLVNVKPEITIHLDYVHKLFVCLGTNGKFVPTPQLMAFYITLLYCSHKGIPFTKKNWIKKTSRIEKQFELFSRILQIVKDSEYCDAVDVEKFYDIIQTLYGKLKKDCFGKLPNKYLHQFAPIYDRDSQTFDFEVLLPVRIIKYIRGKGGDEEKEIIDSEHFVHYIEVL